MSGLIGKKLGMTQAFDETGDVVPVTVIQAGPCVVVQKKGDKEGYQAVQLGFDELPSNREKKTPKAYVQHFKKKNLKATRFLKEFRVDKSAEGGEFEVGQVVTVESFKVGDRVKVTGVSKGKGFQGVIKRHGKAGGPASHGSRFHRTTGSIGQRTSPGEVFKNMKLPGHMGNERVTVRNLKVVQVRPAENLIFVLGAIPGANHNIVMIRKQS